MVSFRLELWPFIPVDCSHEATTANRKAMGKAMAAVSTGLTLCKARKNCDHN